MRPHTNPTTPSALHPPLTVSLGDDIGLHVAVVVFARPDEAAGRLEHLRHHVVDETVLVPDAHVVELRLVVPAGGGGGGGRYVGRNVMT